MSNNDAADPFLLSSDDDNTIKDLLSKFQNPQKAPHALPQREVIPPLPPTPPTPHHQQHPNAADAYQQRLFEQQQFQSPAEHQVLDDEIQSPRIQGSLTTNEFEESYIDRFVRIYAPDVQLLVAFFVISVACGFLPISKFINTYVMSIESIPFSGTVIRSIVVSLMCYIAVLLVRGAAP